MVRHHLTIKSKLNVKYAKLAKGLDWLMACRWLLERVRFPEIFHDDVIMIWDWAIIYPECRFGPQNSKTRPHLLPLDNISISRTAFFEVLIDLSERETDINAGGWQVKRYIFRQNF